jgi:hypothetical protein
MGPKRTIYLLKKVGRKALRILSLFLQTHRSVYSTTNYAVILEVGPDPDSSHRRVPSPDSTDVVESGSESESLGLGPDTLEPESSPSLRRFIYPYLVILRTCT